ncbi:hypothetical protein ACTJKF_09390 [Burkholderia sp. 22313]
MEPAKSRAKNTAQSRSRREYRVDVAIDFQAQSTGFENIAILPAGIMRDQEFTQDSRSA